MIVRLVVPLLLLPVVLLGCAWVTMSAGLPDPLPAVITGVVALLYLIGIAAFAIRHVLRAGRVLDTTFSSAGLGYSGRKGVACCYRGEMNGRSATAGLTLAFVFQPWRLEVTVGAELGGTRIALGSMRPLLDCRGAPRLDCGEPAFADVHIHAEDADAARRLLARPEVIDVLRPLIEEWSQVNSWELYVQPEQVWLRLRTYRLNEAATGRWLDGLRSLAGVCEEESCGRDDKKVVI